jgi:DNA-binding GntR family transcriptional regulator
VAAPRGATKTKAVRGKAPAPSGSEPVRVRGQGAQTVYDKLRQSILDLTLEPGSPLDEVGLSEQFDMSRTPIREALVRLSAEGLVTTLPNRNTIVSSIDFVQLPIYFEALTLMYRVTTRLAASGRTELHLAQMRRYQSAYADAVTRDDVPGMIGTNRDFHVVIAEAGGNPYFTTLFTRLLDEGRRILRLYYYRSFNDHLPRKYVQEHDAIVDAIRSGNPSAAQRAVQTNCRHAADRIAKAIDVMGELGK